MVKFSTLVYRLKDLEKGLGRKGYGCEVGLRCLYLQFHYDLSDRELEKRLRFDMAMKWFCDFTAFEKKTMGSSGNHCGDQLGPL